MTGPPTARPTRSAADREALLAANARFYAAIERGDLDDLAALWKEGEDTSCVHPGTGQLRGTGVILRAWALVMAQLSYVQFVLTDVRVDCHADMAVVTCTENVLHAGHDVPVQSFKGARATATNVFVRAAGDAPAGSSPWQLVVHHASPVLDSWEPDAGEDG